MDEHDLLQDRLHELEDRRSILVREIGELEVKKSDMLRDYWMIHDEINEVWEALDKYEKPNDIAVMESRYESI